MAIVERKQKSGQISYQPRVKDRLGNWYPSECHADRDLAVAEESRLIAMKRKGLSVISGDAKKTTLSEYWEVWSIENRTEVSKGWKISQDQMWRDHIAPIAGHLKLADIGAPHIGRVLGSAKDKGLGPQMRKHIYSLLNTMFNDAVQYYEMLAASPVKAKFHRPRVPKSKRQFLEPAQAWVLLEYMRDHYVGPAVWLGLLAGFRTEAMIALRWRNVLWDSNQILISEGWKQKEKRIQPFPKGKDWEYVPMVPPLKLYLWEHWQRCQDPNQFVCQRKGGGMLPYETFYRIVKRVCEKAGVIGITPHELRHSASELWTHAGATQEDLRRLLNHKSNSSTSGYVHRTEERLNRIGEGIARPGLRVAETTESFPNSFPDGKQEAYATEIESHGSATK